MFRKPSVYAGENEPTAVYDAALANVCQWKNPYLFHFWLVSPTFVPISLVFLRSAGVLLCEHSSLHIGIAAEHLAL
jgi:hypothetical protein